MRTTHVCPGCGARLQGTFIQSGGYHGSAACNDFFNALCGFTLSQYEPGFFHQHAVDAYGAQHAGPPTKNIRVVFSLLGLCLALEQNYSGRQVQLAHMKIPKQEWQLPGLPQQASITVVDVCNANDEDKKEMIGEWMKDVWQSWSAHHAWVRETIRSLGI